MIEKEQASLNELIQHHLSFFAKKISIFGATITFHVDTLVMTACLLGLVAWFFSRAANRLVLSPTLEQSLYEFAVEVVYKEVLGVAPHFIHTIGPLGFSLFISIFIMNLMDFLPTSIGGVIMGLLGSHDNFKVVPTADINTTLALAVLAFLVIQYNAIKYSGLAHYVESFLTHPFGWLLAPMNLLLRCIEEFSKIFSLTFRLYGNMFAGEIIYALLAVSPFWLKAIGVFSWCVFHILIVYLQAFIFMMLVVIGYGLALEH